MSSLGWYVLDMHVKPNDLVLVGQFAVLGGSRGRSRQAANIIDVE